MSQQLSETCPICLHEYPLAELTRHHLVPKSRKGTDTVLLCAACHRQVHALFTEKELEREYSSIARLLEHGDMLRFAAWIRKRKPKARVAVRSSKRKKR